ncbi:MAG TPA: GNAT family N-acetyltransferase [Chitinispirillaceae bacterium]|nr:GNAT family N-acetyltransferase [Chitinispirillaceae bacterium]
MNKIIRNAQEKDLPVLVELLNELFSNELEFSPDPQKQLEGLRALLVSDNGDILVLEIDNEVIGMVSLQYLISTFLGGKVAQLEDMIISNKYRKKGYGSKLFSHALAFARENGCLRVTLLTDYNNDIAIRFYESFNLKKSQMIPMRIVF